MANLATFEFDLLASHDNSGITILVQLDNDEPKVIEVSTQRQRVCFEIDDSKSSSHKITLTMVGKTSDHTRLDSLGQIENDVIVKVDTDSLMLDAVKVAGIFYNQPIYNHNHNGTTEYSDHKFYGVMGCNGTVTLKFSTPVYPWLLENM